MMCAAKGRNETQTRVSGEPRVVRYLLLKLLLQHLLEGSSVLLEALNTLGQLQGIQLELALGGEYCWKLTLSLAILSFFNSVINFSWSST